MPTPSEDAAASTDWRPAAQRLVAALCDVFDACYLQEPALQPDLAALLRIADELERSLLQEPRAQASGDPWPRLRQWCSEIQAHSDILRGQGGDIALTAALPSLDGACERLLEQDPGQTTRAPLLSGNSIGSEGGQLLLFDTDPQGAALLQRALVQAGHTLTLADSRPALLQALAGNSPDLVLLDLGSLGNGDIGTLLQRLRQAPGWQHVPVLAVAERSDHRPVVEALAAGADDYVLRPINPVLLKARINSAIERKRWLDREQRYREELERNQRFMRRVFGRYLSQSIVDALLENPDGLELGGEQRTVTLLMADIRGFTGLCEQLPPAQVVQLLNNYLGRMSEIVLDHRGTVDEFIGDAILAIFGAPLGRHDDCDRAVQCALAMQRAMRDINRDNARAGLPEIRIGISLNTGSVVAGNIGSLRRSKYAVVGHAVNQAARIQEACPPGAVLLSHATLQAAHDMLCIGDSGQLRARGMNTAIRVYRLAGLTPLAPVRRDSADVSAAGPHVGEQQHIPD